MAQLPDSNWLVQQIGSDVVLLHRYTDEEIVRYPISDADATAKAQGVIYASPLLSPEDKAFAHFWCGYFHAYARVSTHSINSPE